MELSHIQAILYLCKNSYPNISHLILPFIIFTDLIQCFIITAFTRAPLILPWPKHHKAPHPHFCSAHAPAKF